MDTWALVVEGAVFVCESIQIPNICAFFVDSQQQRVFLFMNWNLFPKEKKWRHGQFLVHIRVSSCSPYCFAHLAAGNQSSLGVKLRILPRSGTGVGPGGSVAPLWRLWMDMRLWMSVQRTNVLKMSTTKVAGEDRRKEEEYASMLYAVSQRGSGFRNALVGRGWKEGRRGE